MTQGKVVVETCFETGLYVGYVPGIAGAHSQGETLEELNRNLREAIRLLLDDRESLLDDHVDLRLAQQELVLAEIGELRAADRLDRSELHERQMR